MVKKSEKNRNLKKKFIWWIYDRSGYGKVEKTAFFAKFGYIWRNLADFASLGIKKPPLKIVFEGKFENLPVIL